MISFQHHLYKNTLNLNLFRSLLSILLLSVQITGSGQEILTLDNAVKTGLENNFNIRIASNNLKITENNATAGNAGILPSLSLDGGYQTSVYNADLETFTGSVLKDKHANGSLINGDLILEWTLFDNTRMFVEYDRLKNLKDLEGNLLKEKMEQCIADITIAYYQVIKSQSIADAFAEKVTNSEFRLTIEENRISSGLGSEIELLKAQTDLYADRSELIRQRLIVENCKLSLVEILVLPFETDIIVSDTMINSDSLVLQDLIASAGLNNRILRTSKLVINNSEMELKKLKAERLPTFTFDAGLNYLRNETDASFIHYNRLWGPYLGIRAGVSLFDGFSLSRKINNQKISISNNQLLFEEARLSILSQIRRQYNEYLYTFSMLKNEVEHYRLAKRNMELAKTAFESGLISALEIREIQNNLTMAEVEVNNLRYQIKEIEVRLLKQAGMLITE